MKFGVQKVTARQRRCKLYFILFICLIPFHKISPGRMNTPIQIFQPKGSGLGPTLAVMGFLALSIVALPCNVLAQSVIRAPSAGGLCLDISTPEGGAVRAGSNIIAWQCHGGANQIFQINSNGTISAPNTGGLCLDISTPEGGAVRAGSNVIAWQCHGAANQIFRVNSNGTISAPNAGGLCLDISTPEGGTVRAGSNVIAWQCHGAANQRWEFTSQVARQRDVIDLSISPRGGGSGGSDLNLRGDELAQSTRESERCAALNDIVDTQYRLVSNYKRRLGETIPNSPPANRTCRKNEQLEATYSRLIQVLRRRLGD